MSLRDRMAWSDGDVEITKVPSPEDRLLELEARVQLFEELTTDDRADGKTDTELEAEADAELEEELAQADAEAKRKKQKAHGSTRIPR